MRKERGAFDSSGIINLFGADCAVYFIFGFSSKLKISIPKLNKLCAELCCIKNQETGWWLMIVSHTTLYIYVIETY